MIDYSTTKVGDELRLTVNTSRYGWKTGDIVTVTFTERNSVSVVDSQGRTMMFAFEEGAGMLEPVSKGCVCRLCGKNAQEIEGYLTRVNETGVEGIWECRPGCDAKMTPDERVLAAVGTPCGFYKIQRSHHSRPEWVTVGEFLAGAPYRDGRVTDDDAMREEVASYRRTWPNYYARVLRPDGTELSAVGSVGSVGNVGVDSKETEKLKALLSEALKALCLTRDYVGERLLPSVKGWDWFDAGTAICEAIPEDEWAGQFRVRVALSAKTDLRPKFNALDDEIRRQIHDMVCDGDDVPTHVFLGPEEMMVLKADPFNTGRMTCPKENRPMEYMGLVVLGKVDPGVMVARCL